MNPIKSIIGLIAWPYMLLREWWSRPKDMNKLGLYDPCPYDDRGPCHYASGPRCVRPEGEDCLR